MVTARRLCTWRACFAAPVASAAPRCHGFRPGRTAQGEPLPPPVAPTPGGDAGSAPTSCPRRAGELAPQADPGADADFRDARTVRAGRPRGRARGARVVRRSPPGARRRVGLRAHARAPGAAARRRPGREEAARAPGRDAARGGRRVQRALLPGPGRDAPRAIRARARAADAVPAARPASSGPGDEALVELRGALAEATAGVGELPAAVELLGRLRSRRAAHEKAYARAKAGESRRRWRREVACAPTGVAREGARARRAGREGGRVPARAGRRGGRGLHRRRDDGGAPRPRLRGGQRARRPAIRGASGWPSRSRASSSRWARRPCAPPCSPGAPAAPAQRRHCRSSCATRASTGARGARAVGAGARGGRHRHPGGGRAQDAARRPSRRRRRRHAAARARRRAAGRAHHGVPAHPRARGARRRAGAACAQAGRARLRDPGSGQHRGEAPARRVPARGHGGRRANHGRGDLRAGRDDVRRGSPP